MKTKIKVYLPLLSVLLFSSLSLADNKPAIENKQAFSIGDSIEFNSAILKEKRELNIYLPVSYAEDPQRQYPVVYLLDGSRDEDFIHIAGIAQFGAFSWINMMPETIVVGIANVDRKRDFTFPTRNKKDKEDFPTTGSSTKFINFLEHEVKGLIEKNYRTEGSSTLLGQSLGGLLATQIFFQKPHLFTHYIIISPSLWWDDESLLNSEISNKQFAGKVFIGVGKEGEVMEASAKALYQKLNKDLKDPTKLSYQFYEKLSHGDALHLAAYDAFAFVNQPASQ